MRPRPDGPCAGGGKRDLARGVGDGLAEPVREEIGRAHRVDRLRVKSPSAKFGERFRLDEDGKAVTRCRVRKKSRHEGDPEAANGAVEAGHGVCVR